MSSNYNDVQNKAEIISSAMSVIKKKFGKFAITRLGESAIETDIEYVSTGSILLDMAIGIGGVPRGRIVEIFGQESSGKTTLMLSIIAEAQKLGDDCAFIDTEHTFDQSYAKLLGVNTKDLIVSQPDYGEQALEIAEILVRSGAVKVIVLDSVAALTPKSEIDGNMGDSHMGLHARLMSQALRKLAGIVSKTNCTILFTNQIRSKIGVVYGNPDVTTGGNALKFYSSLRLEIKRIGVLKESDKFLGVTVRVNVVKNKVAPPFKTAQFDIMYGEGISKEGEMIDIGSELDIIDKSGSWYSYGEIKLGQGRENAKQSLKQNEQMRAEIEAKIRKYLMEKNQKTFEKNQKINASKEGENIKLNNSNDSNIGEPDHADSQ